MGQVSGGADHAQRLAFYSLQGSVGWMEGRRKCLRINGGRKHVSNDDRFSLLLELRAGFTFVIVFP